MKQLFLVLLVTVFYFKAQAQCNDTLQLVRFPNAVSGIEWSEKDQRFYLVSDLINKVYVAKLELKLNKVIVVDSFEIEGAPHQKGLEAIRKAGNAFYFTFEKDEFRLTGVEAHGFVVKGILQGKKISIQKSFDLDHLPQNKGWEGLTLTKDRKTVLVSHESMARPKEGADSVKVLSFDTDLKPTSQNRWLRIFPQAYFKENTAAYNDYGVTEILVVGDSCYVLERGWGKYSGGVETIINVFKVGMNNWKKGNPLHQFRTSGGNTSCIDNFEGMCYLPSIKKLLIISDDNRNFGKQRTIARLLEP